MSTREQRIQARISMLALADELQNISRACTVAGISRSHFYEIKDAFENYGREGVAPQPRRRLRMPNQTPPELEVRLREMTTEDPPYRDMRIADPLQLIGVPATANQVRGVWLRQGLLQRYDRLRQARERRKFIEQRVAQEEAPRRQPHALCYAPKLASA